MDIKTILSKVEHGKYGWSDARTPEGWEEVFEKRKAGKLGSSDFASAIQRDLGKLQDGGLGQKMPDLPEVKIVGR